MPSKVWVLVTLWCFVVSFVTGESSDKVSVEKFPGSERRSKVSKSGLETTERYKDSDIDRKAIVDKVKPSDSSVTKGTVESFESSKIKEINSTSFRIDKRNSEIEPALGNSGKIRGYEISGKVKKKELLKEKVHSLHDSNDIGSRGFKHSGKSAAKVDTNGSGISKRLSHNVLKKVLGTDTLFRASCRSTLCSHPVKQETGSSTTSLRIKCPTSPENQESLKCLHESFTTNTQRFDDAGLIAPIKKTGQRNKYDLTVKSKLYNLEEDSRLKFLIKVGKELGMEKEWMKLIRDGENGNKKFKRLLNPLIKRKDGDSNYYDEDNEAEMEKVRGGKDPLVIGKAGGVIKRDKNTRIGKNNGDIEGQSITGEGAGKKKISGKKKNWKIKGERNLPLPPHSTINHNEKKFGNFFKLIHQLSLLKSDEERLPTWHSIRPKNMKKLIGEGKSYGNLFNGVGAQLWGGSRDNQAKKLNPVIRKVRDVVAESYWRENGRSFEERTANEDNEGGDGKSRKLSGQPNHVFTWHLKASFVSEEDGLIETRVDWTKRVVDDEQQKAGQHFLLTWEVLGGGLKGNLVTNTTTSIINLMPNTSYRLQVSAVIKKTDERREEDDLKVENSATVTQKSLTEPRTIESLKLPASTDLPRLEFLSSSQPLLLNTSFARSTSSSGDSTSKRSVLNSMFVRKKRIFKSLKPRGTVEYKRSGDLKSPHLTPPPQISFVNKGSNYTEDSSESSHMIRSHDELVSKPIRNFNQGASMEEKNESDGVNQPLPPLEVEDAKPLREETTLSPRSAPLFMMTPSTLAFLVYPRSPYRLTVLGMAQNPEEEALDPISNDSSLGGGHKLSENDKALSESSSKSKNSARARGTATNPSIMAGTPWGYSTNVENKRGSNGGQEEEVSIFASLYMIFAVIFLVLLFLVAVVGFCILTLSISETSRFFVPKRVRVWSLGQNILHMGSTNWSFHNYFKRSDPMSEGDGDNLVCNEEGMSGCPLEERSAGFDSIGTNLPHGDLLSSGVDSSVVNSGMIQTHCYCDEHEQHCCCYNTFCIEQAVLEDMYGDESVMAALDLSFDMNNEDEDDEPNGGGSDGMYNSKTSRRRQDAEEEEKF